MNEGIKQFLENFLTNSEKKAQLKKRIDTYTEELKTWQDALEILEDEQQKEIEDALDEVIKRKDQGEK